QLRKTFPQHGLRLILVEFAHDHGVGKSKTDAAICLGHDPGRLALPNTRTRIDAAENHAPPRPILPQQSSLRLAVCTELVVLRPQKRRLPMAHQDDVAHARPAISAAARDVRFLIQPQPSWVMFFRSSQFARSNNPAAPCPPPMHMVTTP